MLTTPARSDTSGILWEFQAYFWWCIWTRQMWPNVGTCRIRASASCAVLYYLEAEESEEPGGEEFYSVMFWDLKWNLFCPKPEKLASYSITWNVYGGYLSAARMMLWFGFGFLGRKSFTFWVHFQPKAKCLWESFAPFMLGGHEESRGETLLKTWVGQCVLMNIDFRSWYTG